MEKGQWCGSVGRAIASNSRGPQFESSHQQTFILNIYCQLYCKDENKFYTGTWNQENTLTSHSSFKLKLQSIETVFTRRFSLGR